MITRHQPNECATLPVLVASFPQTCSGLTPAKLRRAAKLRREIDSLKKQLVQVLTVPAK